MSKWEDIIPIRLNGLYGGNYIIGYNNCRKTILKSLKTAESRGEIGFCKTCIPTEKEIEYILLNYKDVREQSRKLLKLMRGEKP